MFKKNLVCITLVLCLILSLSTFGYSASTEIVLESDNNLDSLVVGDTVTVDITINNLSSFVGGEMNLQYDENLLSFTNKVFIDDSLIDFTNLEGVSNDNLSNTPGNVKLVFAINKSDAPFSGSLSLVRIIFEVIGIGTGSLSIDQSSKLISEDINGNYGEIPYTSVPLVFNTLGEGSVSGLVTDNSNNPIANATVEIIKDNNVAFSAITSSDGSYSISSIVEGTYTMKVYKDGYKEFSEGITIVANGNLVKNVSLDKIVPGDVNGDEAVTLEDLVIAANYYGFTSIHEEWNTNAFKADMNNDGKVDVTDLIFIYRRITV